MPYSTQQDLEEQISNAELIAITDDAGTGSIDATVLARAIADADAEIDAYVSGSYAVPLSPVPSIIRKVSVDVAIYHLCSRRPVGMPDIRQDRYDSAIRLLKDISKGLVTIGTTDPAPSSDGPSVTKPKSDRIFTRGWTSDSSTGTLDNY